MAVQKSKESGKPKKAKAGKISEKSLADAMTNLERLSKEYIGQSRDKMKVGRKVVDQIRKVAENIESELLVEGINLTEAYDSKDFVGVGVGVL